MEFAEKANAYPLELLQNNQKISDELNGRSINIKFDNETDTVTVQDQQGEIIDHVITYWMVWKGIYPESALYEE